METTNQIEIVVIEDQEDILELIEYHLEKAGYRVAGFTSTEYVLQFLEEENPSLMLVDRNLPGQEGSEFVAQLRNLGYDIPVIFLTARDKEGDLLEGFGVGGDDYMTKPFSHQELLARILSLLKRSGNLSKDKLRYRDMIIDTQKREVLVDDRPIELTNLEYKLLCTFVKNPHQALERDFLRDEVWGDESVSFHDKTINVAMNRLRKKIDPDNTKNYFTPVWGIGYKLS